MKNRKRIVTTFVILAVLCLGVGYAALVDDLYIGGSVSVDVDGMGSNTEDTEDEEKSDFESTFSGNVYFANASATETNLVTAQITADNKNEAKDKLSITVADSVLTHKGDKTTVTVDIQNGSSDYVVEVVPVAEKPSDSNNFRITCVWTDNAGSNEIVAGASKNLTITIELVTAPTADIHEESFAITFSAKAVANSN